MPPKISAKVVDVTVDVPKSTDAFLIDSNIWYWVGYTKASLSAKYNPYRDYSNYLNQSLSEASKLYKCTLSFAELAHSIERSEWEIFQQTPQGSAVHNKKDYRHNFPVERQKVVREIEFTWTLAESMTAGLTLEINLNQAIISASVNRMKAQALDGYDLFMIEAAISSGISQIITDDADFGQVQGMTIFTANKRFIQEAKSQGRFVRR